MLQMTSNIYTLSNTGFNIVFLAVLAASIIILGGIGVYLVEHEHPGANITKLDDAIWWAVVTLATVGYGDYYPVTEIGRIIAIFMMLSGIGIFALLVTNLAQRRLLRRESKLKSTSDAQASVLGQESKTSIKNKIDGIEMLTEDDFDRLIIMMKGVRHTLLKSLRFHTSVRDVVTFLIVSKNFAVIVDVVCIE
jgi:voltage-gated potassium channel